MSSLATQDLYALLGIVVADISVLQVNDIKKGYKKQALLYHPDKGHPSAHVLFTVISAAYGNLMDEMKRERYDRWYRRYFKRSHVTENDVKNALNKAIKIHKMENDEDFQKKAKEKKEQEEKKRKEKAAREKREREKRERETREREAKEQEARVKKARKEAKERARREKAKEKREAQERERLEKIALKKEHDRLVRENEILERRRKEEEQKAKAKLYDLMKEEERLEKERLEKEKNEAKLEEERKEQERLKKDADIKSFKERTRNVKKFPNKSRVRGVPVFGKSSSPTKSNKEEKTYNFQKERLSKDEFISLRERLQKTAQENFQEREQLELEAKNSINKSDILKRSAEVALKKAQVKYAEAMKRVSFQVNNATITRQKADDIKEAMADVFDELTALDDGYLKDYDMKKDDTFDYGIFKEFNPNVKNSSPSPIFEFPTDGPIFSNTGFSFDSNANDEPFDYGIFKEFKSNVETSSTPPIFKIPTDGILSSSGFSFDFNVNDDFSKSKNSPQKSTPNYFTNFNNTDPSKLSFTGANKNNDYNSESSKNFDFTGSPFQNNTDFSFSFKDSTKDTFDFHKLNLGNHLPNTNSIFSRPKPQDSNNLNKAEAQNFNGENKNTNPFSGVFQQTFNSNNGNHPTNNPIQFTFNSRIEGDGKRPFEYT